MSTAARPQVTEWDREYMRRLGRYKAESHADQLANHLARSPRERFLDALTMMLAGPYFERPVLEADDPSPLYERARRLGLIKTGL